ncbi:MAG: glycosyltransferase family 2 protein [Bryobacterales bacterium]|nr:glycosyltransferase family 2 protein [Bryobacterales bacterium]
MPATAIRLAVIIPVYENWEDTLECLQQLDAQTDRRFSVLLADDGSPKAPPPEILRFPFVRYFRRPNAGFAGNCNRAVREAIADGATHVLLLNNDTLFGTGFMGEWLRAIDGNPEAVMSPVIYWAADPQRVWYSGGSKSILVPFFRLAKSYSQTTSVDILCGCTLLVPVKAWEQLGGLDERYFFYFEDLDFTLRARRAGMECLVLAEKGLRVWHKVHGSFRGTGAWKGHYRLIRSQLFFVRAHYGGLQKALALGLCFLHILVFWLLNLPQMPDGGQLRDAVTRGVRPAASVRV